MEAERHRRDLPTLQTAWSVLGVIWVLFLIYKWTGPDTWYHLYLGKWYLEKHTLQVPDSTLSPQVNFLDVSWLAEIIYELTMRVAGAAAITIENGFLWIGVVLVWRRSAGSGWLSWFGALVAVFIFQIRFDERPEVWSFLFLAMDIWILHQWAKPYRFSKRIAFLIAAQIFWANVHVMFFLAPLIAGMKLLAIAIEKKNLKSCIRPALLVLILVSVSCLNPHGPGIWEHVLFQFESLNDYTHAILEMRPTYEFGLSPPNLVFVWIFTLSTIVLLMKSLLRPAFTLKKRGFSTGLALVGICLGISTVRFVPLLVLFAMPIWSRVGSADAPA